MIDLIYYCCCTGTTFVSMYHTISCPLPQRHFALAPCRGTVCGSIKIQYYSTYKTVIFLAASTAVSANPLVCRIRRTLTKCHLPSFETTGGTIIVLLYIQIHTDTEKAQALAVVFYLICYVLQAIFCTCTGTTLREVKLLLSSEVCYGLIEL